MSNNAPYFPIIYVRGFAMTQGEIDGTTADPFCGFNVGATVYRAKADKKERPRKFVFESPVVRLAKDFVTRTFSTMAWTLWTTAGKAKSPPNRSSYFATTNAHHPCSATARPPPDHGICQGLEQADPQGAKVVLRQS